MISVLHSCKLWERFLHNGTGMFSTEVLERAAWVHWSKRFPPEFFLDDTVPVAHPFFNHFTLIHEFPPTSKDCSTPKLYTGCYYLMVKHRFFYPICLCWSATFASMLLLTQNQEGHIAYGGNGNNNRSRPSATQNRHPENRWAPEIYWNRQNSAAEKIINLQITRRIWQPWSPHWGSWAHCGRWFSQSEGTFLDCIVMEVQKSDNYTIDAVGVNLLEGT